MFISKGGKIKEPCHLCACVRTVLLNIAEIISANLHATSHGSPHATRPNIVCRRCHLMPKLRHSVNRSGGFRVCKFDASTYIRKIWEDPHIKYTKPLTRFSKLVLMSPSSFLPFQETPSPRRGSSTIRSPVSGSARSSSPRATTESSWWVTHAGSACTLILNLI